jgi:hypothetical protein
MGQTVAGSPSASARGPEPIREGLTRCSVSSARRITLALIDERAVATGGYRSEALLLPASQRFVGCRLRGRWVPG